jgi:hypothetical protein
MTGPVKIQVVLILSPSRMSRKKSSTVTLGWPDHEVVWPKCEREHSADAARLGLNAAGGASGDDARRRGLPMARGGESKATVFTYDVTRLGLDVVSGPSSDDTRRRGLPTGTNWRVRPRSRSQAAAPCLTSGWFQGVSVWDHFLLTKHWVFLIVVFTQFLRLCFAYLEIRLW